MLTPNPIRPSVPGAVPAFGHCTAFQPGTVPFKGQTMCQSCEVVRINGVLCHEIGCPDAWQDYLVECAWCGSDFLPAFKGQDCCSADCAECYHGWPEGAADENAYRHTDR